MLLPLLDPKELLLKQMFHKSAFLQPGFKIRDRAILHMIDSKMLWWMSIKDFKWSAVEGRMETGVVLELS
jgi:hypothetical protein